VAQAQRETLVYAWRAEAYGFSRRRTTSGYLGNWMAELRVFERFS